MTATEDADIVKIRNDLRDGWGVGNLFVQTLLTKYDEQALELQRLRAIEQQFHAMELEAREIIADCGDPATATSYAAGMYRAASRIREVAS